MIVDASAVLAILLDEPESVAFAEVLLQSDDRQWSAHQDLLDSWRP